MKIDTLAFLNTVIAHHEPTVFHPHLNVSGGYRVRVSDTPRDNYCLEILDTHPATLFGKTSQIRALKSITLR